jgi:hypothetical protein
MDETYEDDDIADSIAISNLTNDTEYYIRVVATNDSSNACDPISTTPASITTVADTEAPTIPAAVTLVLGPTDTTNIMTFSNLSQITYNVDSAPSVTVIYGTVNDAEDGDAVSLSVDISTEDDKLIEGLAR